MQVQKGSLNFKINRVRLKVKLNFEGLILHMWFCRFVHIYICAYYITLILARVCMLLCISCCMYSHAPSDQVFLTRYVSLIPHPSLLPPHWHLSLAAPHWPALLTCHSPFSPPSQHKHSPMATWCSSVGTQMR